MIHTLTFGAQDAAGNVLPAGNPVTLIVDTLPPAMPIVTSVDPNGTLVSGTADAGSTVIIRSGSTILGQGWQTVQVSSLSPFHQRRRRVNH